MSESYVTTALLISSPVSSTQSGRQCSRTHAADCQKVPLIAARLASVTYLGIAICEVDSLTTHLGKETL